MFRTQRQIKNSVKHLRWDFSYRLKAANDIRKKL